MNDQKYLSYCEQRARRADMLSSFFPLTLVSTNKKLRTSQSSPIWPVQTILCLEYTTKLIQKLLNALSPKPLILAPETQVLRPKCA